MSDMIETPSWADYLRAIADSTVGAHIAAKTGIAESTVSRWLSGVNPPKPSQAVAVARAYGTDPIEALIAAGYLEQGDAPTNGNVPRRLQLRDFTDLEIANETVRRIVEGSPILEAPLDEDHPSMQQFK